MSSWCGNEAWGPYTNDTLDFTPCFREVALETVLPLSFIILTLTICGARPLLSRCFSCTAGHQRYDQLLRDTDDERTHLLGAEHTPPLKPPQDKAAQDDADLLLQPKDLPDQDPRPESLVNHPTTADSVLILVAMVQALGFLALVIVRWKFLELGGRHGQPGHIHLPIYRFIMPVAQSIAWSYAFVLCMLAAFTRHIVRPSRIRRMLIVFAIFTLVNSLIRMRTGFRCFMSDDDSHPDEETTPDMRHRITAEFALAILNFLLCSVFAWIITTTSKGPAVTYEGKTISWEFNASFFRWVTFDWMNNIMWDGYERALELEFLPALTDQMRARPMYKIFARSRNYLRNSTKASLLWRIYYTNRRDIWINFIFGVLSSVSSFGMPYFLQHLLKYIEKPEGPKEIAYLYVFGMLFCDVVKSLTFEQNLYYGRRVDVRLRAMLSAEVYAKSLRRKDMTGIVPVVMSRKGARSDTGMITNLMAVDANRVSALGSSIFFLYTCPLEIIIGVVMLYHVLGVSAFIGLAVMLVTAPAHHYAAKKYSRIQEQLMETRDRRVGLVSEMLQGIRMIKFFAWENNIKKKIMEIRDQELRRFIRLYIVSAIFTLLWFGSPILVTVMSFTSYTKLEGKELTSTVAFTSMAIFIILRGPLNILPGMVADLLEAMVSIRRIETFLSEREIWKYTDEAKEETVPAQPPAQSPLINAQSPPMQSHAFHNVQTPVVIGFDNATFRWHTRSSAFGAGASTASTNNGAFSLKNITLNFPVGKLSLVCGSTGSGKTSLLMALLREMDLISGKVNLPRATTRVVSPLTGYIPGAVAYVSQYPWLQQASIRDNIMFGSPFEADRYQHVLEACALLPDLQIFENGDLTEIGEKGITLSGGQKQRVALARAIYSRAQFLLFDDCLSAVDAHTARHLFENCLMGPLMNGRTRILVTHHVRLCLRDAAYVALLKEGSLILSGSPVKLIRSGFLSEILERNGMMEEDKDSSSSSTLAADHGAASNASSVTSGSPVLKAAQVAKKLVDDEGRPRGKVKLTVYKMYMAACGGAGFWIILTFILLVVRMLGVLEIVWLKWWTESYYPFPRKPGGNGSGDLDYYIGIYCFITLMAVFLTIVRMFWQFYGSIRASRSLYEELLVSIVRAPIRFFDTTPVGRIINRFSKDFEVIDGHMITKMVTVLLIVFGIIAVIVIISAATPEFLVAVAVIATAYFFVGAYYIASSRELKRIESITKSPLYSHFGETLVGVSTIRAFGAEARFMEEVLVKLDNNNSPYYFLWMCNRWLSVRVDFLGSMVTFIAGILILINMNNELIQGWAGVSLGSSMNFMGLIYWLVRIYTDMEMSLNSVERVHEYIDMPQEPPAIIEESRPPAGWPYDGTIEIKDLTMQYAPDLGPVLHQISINIRPREKIGIVGRTGSGKSTLALSLFRFMEPTSGSIVIDGINISDIGLEDLRRRLTIIPQDAVLFNGTIRSNLDPFQEHEDHEVWEALRRVHLIKPKSPQCSPSGYSSPIQDPLYHKHANFHHHPHAHYDDPSYPMDPEVAASATEYGHQTFEDPFHPPDVLSSSLCQGYLDYRDHSADSPLLASAGLMPSDSVLCAPLNHGDYTDLTLQQQQQCAMMGLIDPFASLDSPVSDGGYNFSQGQRQLLCMARALLRQSKVIIMDEATASVDFATDEKIQTTIRNELGDSTLITVAHRLRTIMDYDRVLVLEQGHVMEFDSPINLITNPTSRFRDMVEKSGDMDTLFEMAARAY